MFTYQVLIQIIVKQTVRGPLPREKDLTTQFTGRKKGPPLLGSHTTIRQKGS